MTVKYTDDDPTVENNGDNEKTEWKFFENVF